MGKRLNVFLILGPSSLPCVVAQPDERHANRTAFVLEWYDKHRAYNIWFNEKDVGAFWPPSIGPEASIQFYAVF